MTYRIVVRGGNIPWATMTHASFIGQSKDINLPRHLAFNVDTLELVKAWEAAHKRSYFLYRETIRRVCRGRLEKLTCDAGIGIRISNSVEEFIAADDYKESDIILPIDDDDIFLPPVFEVIGEHFIAEHVNLVVWARTTVYHGKERTESGVHPYLDTNNWAIHGSYLRTFTRGEQIDMLRMHQKAHTTIGKRLDLIPKIPNVIGPDFFKVNNPSAPLKHPSVVDLGSDQLSLYYLHCGSISFLAHKVGDVEDLVTTLRNLPLHPLFDEDVYQSLQGDTNEASKAAS